MREAGRKYVALSLQALALCAFAVYLFTQAWRIPAVWQDSEAYRAASMHPLWSAALWAGSRAPLAPVLFKLTGDQYFNYVVAQAVIGFLAWGFLAWTVSMFVAAGWRRVVVVFSVLGFATAPLVVQWDWSALSESPSMSALALLCAIGLWLVRRFTWVRLVGLALSALAYVGLRDEDIWSVGLVGLMLLVFAVWATIRGAALVSDLSSLKGHLREKWGRTRRAAVVGGVLVLVALLAELGAYSSHRNTLNIEEAFFVRVFPFPERVAWFSAHGMPDGGAIDQLAHPGSQAPETLSQAQVVAPDLSETSWAPLRAWFGRSGVSTYALYLVTHPVYTLFEPFSLPALTYNNADGNLAGYDPTGHLSLAAFEDVFAPGKLVVFVMAAVGLTLAISRGTWKRAEIRFLVAFTLVGLVSMLLAWHGEGEEVTRHMVEGSVEVRLGVLLFLLLAVLLPERPDEPVETAPVAAVGAAADVGVDGRSRSPEVAEPEEASADRLSSPT